MELVSAIITTHGRLELLKKAINSVLNQTYSNIELIVIDDCSTDGTKEWAENELPNRANYIYIKKEDSKGGNHARNIGISLSKGKYIAFLDDDDVWYPTKIEKQVKLMQTNPQMVMSYCGHRKVYDNGSPVTVIPSNTFTGDLHQKVHTMVFCTTSMIMIQKSILSKSGIFDENLRFWQEYDLIIRLCQYGQVGCVPEVLVDILHSTSDASRLSIKIDGWLEAVDYITQKYLQSIDSLSKEEKKKRQLMIYNDAANRCYAADDMKRHQEFLKKAWQVDYSLKHWVKYKLNLSNRSIESWKKKIKKSS